MFSVPSTSDLHHQTPRGSVLVIARISRPAGSARSTAAVSGRSGGSNSVVTRYVVPQAIGARAVTAVDPQLIAKHLGNIAQRLAIVYAVPMTDADSEGANRTST